MLRFLLRSPKAHTVQLPRFFIGAILLCGLFTSSLHAQHVEWASEVLGYSTQKAPYGAKQYSADQVLGKPNKCPATGDSPCAWLPASDPDQGMQEEWIKVGFSDPMKIQQVAVAENYYPGAIEKIILFDDNDRKRDSVVYQPHFDGIEAKVAHWIFQPRTRYEVTAVEIVLQPGLVQGPNEIDAIAISDLTTPLQAEINVAPNVNVGPRENLGPSINLFIT